MYQVYTLQYIGEIGIGIGIVFIVVDPPGNCVV